MTTDPRRLMELLRQRGIATGAELRTALGVSQPTLSRLVAKNQDELLAFGRTRAAQYAARDVRSAFGSGVAIYRVREGGRITTLGTLVPIVDGRTVFVRDANDARVYPSVPWFIEELRPQGYLGRLFVRASPPELQLPADARHWSNDQLLRALVYRADDLPGDLLVGAPARDRYLHQRASGAQTQLARSEYANVIARQLAGENPGSSAGGEQPKFACVDEQQRHLIVKYSPPLSESRSAKRWADLLRCEELALRVLRDGDISTAQAAYVEVDGRAYLEVERFDRTAAGRVAVVTGTLVDAEFIGASSWTALATGLAREERLPAADADTVRLLYLFGVLIGNTDMHLGNLAFFTEDYERFRLAPTYDMLPMALRPTAHGELPRVDPPYPVPTPEDAELWLRADPLAQSFFELVRKDPALDQELREFADRRAERVAALAAMAASIA